MEDFNKELTSAQALFGTGEDKGALIGTKVRILAAGVDKPFTFEGEEVVVVSVDGDGDLWVDVGEPRGFSQGRVWCIGRTEGKHFERV